MPVYFNGRTYISPTTASAVDDTALANRNLNIGNVLAIVGICTGGRPQTPLTFSNPTDAKAVLGTGNLRDAVVKAFDPSAETPAPSRVVAVRVNPATQSSLDLLDAADDPVINLVSTDYGLRTNQLRVKVEAGTVAGKKLTTQFGNASFVQDNVQRRALMVRYTGAAASATITVTNTTVTLEAPNGTPVLAADLATYGTYQALADVLDAAPGFAVSVLDGNGELATLNGLDSVADADVKTADYVVRADLQAAIDWFNGNTEGYVDASRPAGAGLVPANIPLTYLTGGSEGATTNTDWANCFEALQAVDVQWLCPVTFAPDLHAMADAHCQFMSTVGRSERRCIVGGALGLSIDFVTTQAKALNSDRTSYVYPGHYDFDASGALVLRPPFMTAAIIAAAMAGLTPGDAMTNRSIKVRGLERELRNPADTDGLLTGGVMCVEKTETGFRVVQSISTWQNNRNYNRVEQSVGAALDLVARQVRKDLDSFRGKRGTPENLALAADKADSTLRALSLPQPNGPGVLVGDADSPPYRNIRATIEADVLHVQFECSPVIPINYCLVLVAAVPFVATVTA